MANLLPNGRQQFIDVNGNPMVGGKVYMYEVGTETPKTTWQDPAGTIPNTNPIILDNLGSAAIWGTGSYRQIVEGPLGNTEWDTEVDTPASDTDVTNLTTYVNQQIALVESNLAASSGASLVGFIQAGTGAVPRTMQSKGRDTVSLYDFGAVGDGTTDDTASVQAAINFAQLTCRSLLVPATANGFKITAPLTVTGPVHFQGEYVEPCAQLSPTTGVNVRGPGSWFYLNHSGIGFNCNVGNGASVAVVRFSVDRIGTYRDQPVPTTDPYTPQANDFDFYLYNCDSVMTNFCTLNPTKGVRINATPTDSASRAYFCNWQADPLSIGLQVDFLADVLHMEDTHFWPFSVTGATALTYKEANCQGLVLYRCDNPMVSKFFTYGLKNSIYIGTNAQGTTSKFQLCSYDFDSFGDTGILIDATGASASFVQGVMQGASTTTSNNCIATSTTASGSDITIVDFNGGFCSQNIIRVVGTANNVVRIGGAFRGFNWNGGNNGSAAIEGIANNIVYIDCTPNLVAPLNSGVEFGSGGYQLNYNAPVPIVSATTDGSGNAAIPNPFGRVPRGCIVSIINGGEGLFAQPSALGSASIAITIRDFSNNLVLSTAVSLSAMILF